MDINAFFEKVIGNQNKDERVAKYLLARGFLIEKMGDSWYLSDNSHSRDIDDLNRILVKKHIGKIDEKRKIHQQYSTRVFLS